MTIFAGVGSAYMRGSFTNSLSTVVTTITVIAHSAVIEDRPDPAIGRMTIITVVGACDMRGRLTGGGCPVMTTVTRSVNRCMIHSCSG